MIRAVVSDRIRAAPDRVQGLYEDPGGWGRLFPATIRGARVVRDEGAVLHIEVDHVEGLVRNVLRRVSSTTLELREWKRRYAAAALRGWNSNLSQDQRQRGTAAGASTGSDILRSSAA